MTVPRCEKCDLIIGEGCSCNLSPASPRHRPYASAYRWARFGPDALLISSSNMAHVPGACGHMTEEFILNPDNGWGWISDPDPDLWTRISPAHPAQATEGNTSRAATVRCSSCVAGLSA